MGVVLTTDQKRSPRGRAASTPAAVINPAETSTDRITVEVNLPPGGPLSGMAADVRAGLTRPFKELSPRYFYDERGSELFEQTAERIADEYAGVSVRGLVCDFEFDLERVPVEGPRVIALLGGTIGNFAPHQRAGFLRRIANLLGEEDRFLLGTDLVKDPETLETAYNDPQGVTAEFNKNVLAVLNRELGADFDVDSFEHVARWDPENLWVDIRLRSLANQVVNVSALDMLVPFAADEEMRTEISTKFLRPGLEGIYAEAGAGVADLGAGPRGGFR